MPATRFSDGRLRLIVAPAFASALYPARYIVCKGGRAAGRSQFFAEKMVARCIERQPTSAACIREVQKSLRFSAKRLIEKKIREFGAQGSFQILENEIRTPGGGVIIFQGMQNHTADSIQSLEDFDIAWAEEARSLSENSLDLLRPTFRKEGSELWFSYNPRFPKDPVDKFFRDPQFTWNSRGYSPEADCIMVHSNWDQNPWLPKTTLEEIMRDRKRDKDKYQHIWLGGYRRHSEASVFKRYVVEEFETPANARFYFGADWGFSVDPAVLTRCFFGEWIDRKKGLVRADERGRTLFIDKEAYKVGCEIDLLPALFAGDDTIHRPGSEYHWRNPYNWPGIPGALKWRITADSQRPDTISYMGKRSFNIVPAIKGTGSVEEGVEFLKSFDVVIHPDCTHTSDEFMLYSYEVDEKTQEVLPKLADRNNNVIDAARYAIERKRRAGVSMLDHL